MSTVAALQDLGLALASVAGEGSQEKELLLAISRCLCTSLSAAQHATDADASPLALRLVNALDGLLARCRERSLTTEVCHLLIAHAHRDRGHSLLAWHK